ncbi:hypothetical protein [Thermomonospora curvata]|uniref:Uncharacterized protein n=1 Tax=Thermomonospora curvata (strain ATCC 19995 / DSM 43183 / JCM 3096 / KCTC 9072 / NBRC 15933 / NCIMB 10081 / Henssen B9) TaxID=471852 RepID=D1A892_THECD|nr:hypothetical protein [Thermomonospora curvata]ACZ00407.1 hypothetical protein Tcur_4890 [Thermomonospora curvata DSM 43183]
MNDRRMPQDRLAALAAHLAAHRMEVDLSDRGLLVRDQGTGTVVALVVCRRRAEDAGTLWFFTGTGEPLAPSDRITDAALALRGRLSAGAGEAR